jgi:uncharacterized phiE125 gp8 family phage protein
MSGVGETGPVPIAVPLDEAKAWLRMEAGADDAVLTAVLRSATAACEDFTGVALVAREAVVVLPITGDWQRLPGCPVAAITAVEGVPAEGSAFALPVASYAVDIDAGGDGWVRVTQPGAAGRVRVTYRVGMAGSAGVVPEALRQGMLMLAARMMRERDDPGGGPAGGIVPGTVEALWRAWRRLRLG